MKQDQKKIFQEMATEKKKKKKWLLSDDFNLKLLELDLGPQQNLAPSVTQGIEK